MARLLCPWDSPRQEYWSGCSFPPPGDLPDPGIKPMSPALAGGFFTTEPSRHKADDGSLLLQIPWTPWLVDDIKSSSLSSSLSWFAWPPSGLVSSLDLSIPAPALILLDFQLVPSSKDKQILPEPKMFLHSVSQPFILQYPLVSHHHFLGRKEDSSEKTSAEITLVFTSIAFWMSLNKKWQISSKFSIHKPWHIKRKRKKEHGISVDFCFPIIIIQKKL